jgi:hypothetical protein
VRARNNDILCSYERAGKIFVARSRDEGRTWDDEVLAAEYPFGNAPNPELLLLDNGWVLLSYNERPNDRLHPFAISLAFSRNEGGQWEGHRQIYVAGIDPGTGCWEPAAVQMPSGEVQLFFANENPYPNSTEQEITMLRSADRGETWSEPKQVSLRPEHRDGMPVPLLLADGSGLAIAIEDNGVAGAFKPSIVFTALEDTWSQSSRLAALDPQLPEPVYAGAPYLRQFPRGETVLSVQSGEGRSRQSTLTYSQMVVYIGDASARHFANGAVPFPIAPEGSGLWNSLFIKNETTVTAITGGVVNGTRGLWAIDGRMQR